MENDKAQQNHHWFKKEMKKRIKDFLDFNKMNLQNNQIHEIMNAVLREKFTLAA